MSQGFESDKLIVQVNLSQFLDEHGNKLPISLDRIKSIPVQVKSKAEAEAIEEAGSTAQKSSTGSCIASFILNLLLKASLSQLWGMLNSQQIVVHLPMFMNLKFPANSMMIIEKMITLATFDLIPTEDIDNEIHYWPESDPFSVNFETAGVESVFLLANIGFAIYMIYMHCIASLIHASLHIKKKAAPWIVKLREKLGAYLYWEGLNRFYMELFFDLMFLSLLNLHMADWSS